jgi:hypothetical protein
VAGVHSVHHRAATQRANGARIRAVAVSPSQCTRRRRHRRRRRRRRRRVVVVAVV